MKIKFQGTINNMSLKKDGEYRVEFKIPLLEISKAISMVRLLNTGFKIGIISEEKNKAIISTAYFYRLAVDKEGESKVTICFSFENISNDSLAFFGKHQDESVIVVIKKGNNNE